MKKIFCPKCDNEISISKEKANEALRNSSGKLSLLCTDCGKQLNIKIKSKVIQSVGDRCDAVCSLDVLENVFGYRQTHFLYVGDNHIGRRNKDTATDVAIVSSDPSMDRHHCIITCKCKKDGTLSVYLQDDDSMTGTFLRGQELSPSDRLLLTDGDVITIGATTIIFRANVPEMTYVNLSNDVR